MTPVQLVEEPYNMSERPHARYSRERTWAALYSQHINAGYAIVPGSLTSNSLWLIRCKSPEEAAARDKALLAVESDCTDFFAGSMMPDLAPPAMRGSAEAVVLAKSSDYWIYHLAERPALALVVCGFHDSYLPAIPTWETGSNKRYEARATSLDIGSPAFEQARGRGGHLAHSILVSALAAGDLVALSYAKCLPERTRRRLTQQASEMQKERYRGRHLTFHTEAKRQMIGAKISTGLLRYHAGRKAV